jgi:galactose oxidase
VTALTEAGGRGPWSNAAEILRLGAVTHSVNNDQRRISLTATAATSTSYNVTIPADRWIVLPGYYMLFALDAAGVPSVAKTIKIS